VCDALVVTSETTNRFVRWSESLPESALIDHPRIMLSLTQALIVTGKLAGAESLVRTMMAHPWFAGSAEEPEHRQRQAELLAVRSRLAAYRGDDRQTMVLAKIALELLGNDDPAKRASLELDLGFANRTYGQLDTAAMHFANASRLGWETGSYQPALWGTRYLALVWLAQGRLREAVALIESDLERVQENGRDGEAIHACLLITQGELRYEQFDLAGARVALETGLDLARRTSDAKILMNGYVALALLEMAEDHPDTALLMLRRGMRIFNGRQEAALQAGVALTAGQVAAAQQWMRESGLSVSDHLLPDRGPAEQLTFAKVLLATGESTAAISLLQRLLDAVTERGWQGRAIDIQVLLSGALLRTGQRDAARIMLLDAIRTAWPEGIVRPFVASGPEIHGLLREVLRSRDAGLDRDYVTRMMALVANPAASADARSADTAGLPEALTERQMDVLRLLAAGHTNREIAAALFLAEGTVKAHVFQICAKLLVRNRTEAVARARSLGLV
jgi:LuxR family maltose regulon positive regulatory protein